MFQASHCTPQTLAPQSSNPCASFTPLPQLPAASQPVWFAHTNLTPGNPVPMDIDVACKAKSINNNCQRCGEPGHWLLLLSEGEVLGLVLWSCAVFSCNAALLAHTLLAFSVCWPPSWTWASLTSSLLHGLSNRCFCQWGCHDFWQHQMEAAFMALIKGGENTFKKIEEILHVHMRCQVPYLSSPLIQAASFHSQDRERVS